MGIAFYHFNFAPMIHGVIMLIGVAVMWFNAVSGRCLSLLIDVGSMAGGLSPVIGARLGGVLLPMVWRE